MKSLQPSCRTVVMLMIGFLTLSGCTSSHSQRIPALKDLHPNVEHLASGLTRCEYRDARFQAESFPVAVTYFDGAGRPVDPFKRIRVGMTAKEVKAILGEPYIEHRAEPLSYMYFRRVFGTVEVKYDASGIIVRIGKPE